MRGGFSPSPEDAAVAGDAVIAPGKGDDEVEADSPVTPFSFSPSDTEEKQNRLKRKISNSGIEKEDDESNEIQLKEGEIGMMCDSDEKLSRMKWRLSNKKEEIVEIPDLNIPILIDVVEPVDDSKKSSTEAAMAAAEARQRRIQILREKKYKSNSN